MRNTKTQSLRYQVEKWLAPTTPVHVTAFRHTRSGGARYVCVETRQATGFHALFFFRHDDGYWNVFPPARCDDAGSQFMTVRGYAVIN
ncbi:hypothetical protein [Paraburkholderia unamae]|uniref:Uncharacterized protein n=1 Tax=Paraburkholderia unamae TaxID=219649 RepID=A0ABX5KK17_9BURK|nr:hypothetical protein [Paraburkholderia unamae]PVX81778.1 hypothetical protein C7402_110182 [Paraburkholderia unamae]CAG9265306.1 hypothetical protein PUN4_50058 [Paraburkholderia unamae]